jgi:hypothetical protein
MKPQEKAKLLIQKAQDKAKADFEAWRGGYLAEKLKHREPLEARDILRHRYTAIQDWYLSNSGPEKFKVRGIDPESLVSVWKTCFQDWEEGLIPLPGITPEYSAEAYDRISGEPLGAKIPAPWINELAERYKAVFCMEHLDTLLQGGTVKEQKPNTRIQALYHYYTRPDLSGHKTELQALGKELGLSSGITFYQCFNAVGHIRNPKNPLKPEILREVIPMLEEFPEAQERAKKDLEKLQKGTGK